MESQEPLLDNGGKCRELFGKFDRDNQGVLSKEGVRSFIKDKFLAKGVECLGELDYDKVVDKVFHRRRQDDRMTYSEFEADFAPGISSEASNIDSKAKTHKVKRVKSKVGEQWHRVKKFGRKHSAEIFWLVLYFQLMAAVFVAKASQFDADPAVGHCIRVAKGFAQLCLVNTVLVLLPMCRILVTGLRALPVVTNYLPIDQHIEFHKICGVVLLLAALGHTAAWIAIIKYARTAPHSAWERSACYHLTFVREESLVQLAQRVPIWTGLVMLLCAAVAGAMCVSKIRRGSFNLFWLSHMLFIPFLVLMAFHGFASWVARPQAHYWVFPPLLIYFIEKRYRMGHLFGGMTTITEVQLFKKTVAISMRKPSSFRRRQRFLPGMYVFVNVPKISKFEWHPFTISSAPEDEFLSLHIERSGDWTGELYDRLKGLTTTDAASGLEDPRYGALLAYPTIFVDGPFGSPAQDYARYRQVVLIGAGVGVTPFASILKSIMHQWKSYQCGYCRNLRFPPTFQLRKIYFYWVTREQDSLTWFASTMNELSELDTDNRLEIHTFYTADKGEDVIAPLRALQTFIHTTEGQDIVSGLQTKQRTHFGRPDWNAELARVARNHAHMEPLDEFFDQLEEIGVFCCGPKKLSRDVHEQCAVLNVAKQRPAPDVQFDFHSEKF
ncbi:NADPH oxidase 4 [Phytophthora pseudosyringae]|uniref:NADPH oxidase 4 n=1 Tax=Phytophthora pseudosyringae TaxID=221518 RepID=A0A8T1V580_9STRA|nr:NADPH oxidase 4 [Phytophthora pseudosyringae]